MTTPFVEEKHETYSRVASFSAIETADGTIESDMASVYAHGYKKTMASLGTSFLTVIPVAFSDYPSSLLENQVEGKAIPALENAFFGDGQGNQYFSVASYYDQASFSHLHIKGRVASKWFIPSFSAAELYSKRSPYAKKTAMSMIYEEAVEWNNKNFPSNTLKDGDPIYFVYCAPYDGYPSSSGSRSSFFWAFTINDPVPAAWSSFYMANLQQGRMDAHTFIHETGHLLGLKDYYNINAASDFSAISPLGHIDMMDCSLGDQNTFSKMILGWNRPYVVDKPGVVTLSQAAGNGSCLLIPNGTWNGSPFDEYLLLEFYTPTLLNRIDVVNRADPCMRLPNASGIKVFHVDARLGIYDSDKTDPVSLIDKTTSIEGKQVDLYFNNGEGSGRYLIRLLDASGSNSSLIKGYVASDHQQTIDNNELRDALFKAGQGTSSSVFSDFRFHDGKALSYQFTVTEVGASYAKINVSF